MYSFPLVLIMKDCLHRKEYGAIFHNQDIKL